MKSLILDLQYNGGGYLGAAVDVANEFLEIGDLIVYTEGRAIPRETYTAKGGGRFGKGRLAVLVDEFTASAAEIVSGAVQDHDRGIIVGRRTFGKGLVQRPVPLPDGAMIRLTVAHYYTPSGRCIQKPYEKGNKRDYDMDLVNRYTHGELTSIDSVHLDSSKVYKTLERGRVSIQPSAVRTSSTSFRSTTSTRTARRFRKTMVASRISLPVMKCLRALSTASSAAGRVSKSFPRTVRNKPRRCRSCVSCSKRLWLTTYGTGQSISA